MSWQKISKTRPPKGHMLTIAIFILFLTVLALFPLLSRNTQNVENSVGTRLRQQAETLAEAAQQFALWKYTENSTTYNTIQSGGKIPDFDGTFVFSDQYINSLNPESGTFTVDISLGDQPHEIRIRTVGQPSGKKMFAEAEYVYEDVTLENSVFVEGNLDVTGVDYGDKYIMRMESEPSVSVGPEFHWGQIMANRGIDVENYTPRYPQKKAAWRVAGRDIGDEFRMNTDRAEYWAVSSDVAPLPEFDLFTLRQQAEASTDFEGGSTYVNMVSTLVDPLELSTQTTWFFTGDVIVTGEMFVTGIVIILGDLTITETAVGANAAGDMIDIPLPPGATSQYIKEVELNGDFPAGSFLVGNPFVTSVDFPANQVGISGFVYVGGNVSVTKTSNSNPFYIYGTMVVKGRFDAGNKNAFRVYYGDYKNDFLPWPVIDRPNVRIKSKSVLFHTVNPS